MMSKVEELQELRDISASVYRHPKLLDRHPELTMIKVIVAEVEAKILSRGQCNMAGRSEVMK